MKTPLQTIQQSACKRCGKKTRLKTHKYCSQTCLWESMRGIKGELANNWKPVVGKSQVHKWLDVHYGQPKICENKDCEGKSIHFDWAKKRDKTYERDRANFLRLCRSCHSNYDMTEERKKQISDCTAGKPKYRSRKPVYLYRLGELIGVFPMMKEVARALRVVPEVAYKVTRGAVKDHTTLRGCVLSYTPLGESQLAKSYRKVQIRKGHFEPYTLKGKYPII